MGVNRSGKTVQLRVNLLLIDRRQIDVVLPPGADMSEVIGQAARREYGERDEIFVTCSEELLTVHVDSEKGGRG